MKTLFKATWCITRYLRHSLPFHSRFPSLSSTHIPLVISRSKHVAIVGSGPAGFYSAQQILKGDPEVKVDIFEKLPVPFGLVRFGVAPDHPEVKNVINTFTQTAQNERFTFFGNVEVGKDVSLQDLREAYTAVILCYGASDDKLLGIPGENLSNVLSARSFVGWYNGLPEDKKLNVNLDCESAVILGHGNVALDVARILLSPIELLQKTDITEYALEALSKSRIKRVHLVGRRGPLQVAFTIKELRELIKLPGIKPIIDPDDVRGLDSVIPDLPRPRKRLTDLIFKTAICPSETDNDKLKWDTAPKQWHLVFKRTPINILGTDEGKVKAIKFSVNQLKGTDIGSQKAVTTEKEESLDCGLVLRSIGYRSLPLNDTIPFDVKRGIILNQMSRVQGEKGLYCAGWVGTGPIGVILTTMTNGFEVGKVVLQDLHSDQLQNIPSNKRHDLIREFKDKSISFKEWEKIDFTEKAKGEKTGKSRDKITDVDTMVNVAKG